MDIICPFHRCVEVNIDFSFFFCNCGLIHFKLFKTYVPFLFVNLESWKCVPEQKISISLFAFITIIRNLIFFFFEEV